MDLRTVTKWRMPRLHTFDALKAHRDYRLLWFGNFSANSAQWLQLLTVGWLVRDLTDGSSLQVMIVGGLTTVPVLIVGPWSGVLGDRVDRRKLLMMTQTFMAALGVLFAVLYAADQITAAWHVYVYVLLSGITRTITIPMQQALIANTVPREDLARAYATNVLTIPGTRIAGPFVGGILIATLGFTWNFALEAALYAAMVLVLIPMRTPYRLASTTTHESPLANLQEGVGYIWKKERVILNLMMLAVIVNVILHPVWFLFPIFVKDVLERGADYGGYLTSVTGIGGFLAALAIASVGFTFKKGMSCFGAAALSSVCVIFFAQSEWLIPSFILMGFMAFFQAYFRTTHGALIQLLVPDALRGRVTSLQHYDMGFAIFSSVLIGLFADWTSAPTASTVVGIIGLALAVFFLFRFRRIRQLE